jgi:hypothetical protein
LPSTLTRYPLTVPVEVVLPHLLYIILFFISCLEVPRGFFQKIPLIVDYSETFFDFLLPNFNFAVKIFSVANSRDAMYIMIRVKMAT